MALTLVEYCTVAWSPAYTKDKAVIDKIQGHLKKNDASLAACETTVHFTLS
jgi:hypothetical protein